MSAARICFNKKNHFVLQDEEEKDCIKCDNVVLQESNVCLIINSTHSKFNIGMLKIF